MSFKNYLPEKEREEVRVRPLNQIKSVEDFVQEENGEKIAGLIKTERWIEKIADTKRKYAQFLSCLNNEWQMITYLYCMDYHGKSGRDMERKFQEIVGKENPCPLNKTFEAYAERFVQYGFAERIDALEGAKWACSKRRDEIAPVMLFGLYYAAKKKRSFEEILGRASSKGTEYGGPYSRARILSKIAETGSFTTVTNLAKSLSLDKATAMRHLKKLKEIGDIEFYHSRGKSFWINYQNRGDIEEMLSRKQDENLKNRIFNLLFVHGNLAREEIKEMLECRHINYVSTLLAKMASEGIIGCELMAKDKSKIKITDRGKEDEEMLQKIWAAAARNEYAIREMSKIKLDRESIRKASLVYFPHSRMHKRLKAKKSGLIRFIEAHDGEVRRKEMMKKTNFGDSLINQSLKEGTIRKAKRGREIAYICD